MPSDPGRPQRLHPTSLAFSFVRHVKGLIVPLILVLFFASSDSWELWFAVLVVPAMIWEIYRYISLRYRFGTSELVVTDGVIFKNERHVPFDRVQNIDLTQGVLQRLCGVADVRIETASGSEAEAVLRVLSLRAVEEMRARVFAGRVAAECDEPAEAEDDASAARTMARLSLIDLVLLGFSPGRGAAVAAVLLGAAWEFGAFDSTGPIELLFGLFQRLRGGEFVLTVFGVTVAFLVALIVLSVIWYTVRLFDYRLTRDGDDFRITCGLFTRISGTVPRHRIQFVSVHEPLVHRLLGRASIRIETAGTGDLEAKSVTHLWFVPLTRRSEVGRLLREIDPAIDIDAVVWRPLAPRARQRMFRRAALGALIAGLVAVAPFGTTTALVVFAVVLALASWHAHLESRYIGWASTPFGVVFKSGGWNRATSIALDGKMQVVTATSSPFDRRYRMATLRVDTAGASPVGHRVHVPYVEEHVAQDMRCELRRAAEHAGFRW